ncbi:MAG: hypothetical protein AAF551_12625 [Bacteroidota bacterium]
MNFDNDRILAQLDKITSDKLFARSKINVRLLDFLVTSTLENRDVKEMTIGTAFFGANYDPVKSDNKVRVYVYHLRKKLDEYYRTSAQPDEIVFQIAKGQYQVQFEPFKKLEVRKRPIPRWAYFMVALVAGGAMTFLFYQLPVNDFWKTLMHNEFSTTVVFGDYFTIEGPITTGGSGVTRDYEINSEQDLRTWISKNPEQTGKVRASRHHYFNWMAPYCSKVITEFWGKRDYPFDIIQISEWSVAQLENENLVYFGQSKSMGVLKNILVEKFPQYTYKSQVFERLDPETKETTVYKDVITYDDKMTDYTVVAKISMPTGNEMRFFLSDQDYGAISALEYFTNDEDVATFYERHGLSKADDFIALFEVTGWLRKSYEMKFILLDRS